MYFEKDVEARIRLEAKVIVGVKILVHEYCWDYPREDGRPFKLLVFVSFFVNSSSQQFVNSMLCAHDWEHYAFRM